MTLHQKTNDIVNKGSVFKNILSLEMTQINSEDKDFNLGQQENNSTIKFYR